MKKRDDVKFLAFAILFSVSFLFGIFVGLNQKNSTRNGRNVSQSVSVVEVS